MPKGIKRKLNKVLDKVNKQIASSINRDNIYSRGLASEGYNGGYRDALSDVLLALNGAQPNRQRWWDESDDNESNKGKSHES